MAEKYVQHIVATGDTVQFIAQKWLGDMSRWMEIVALNKLRYPYIVDTVDEKVQQINEVVTIGDTLIVNVTETVNNMDVNLDRLSQQEVERIYAFTIGKDLHIAWDPKEVSNNQFQDGLFSVRADEQGGLDIASGIDNLKQSIYVRLLTPKGTYIGHPNFGSRIQDYIGETMHHENMVGLDLEIERTIKSDPRIAGANLVDRWTESSKYYAVFHITPRDIDVTFEIMISALSDTDIRMSAPTYQDPNL